MRRSSVDQWFHSASRGNHDNLEKLLDTKTAWNIDIRDELFRSALFLAAEKGNNKCVESLLMRGADPNKNSQYGTAAHAAAEAGHADILRLLVSYGAHLATKNLKGLTVLECAKMTFGEKKAQELLDKPDHTKFDRLKRKSRKSEWGLTESSENLRIGVIASPLPVVKQHEIKQCDGDIYAEGPDTLYMKGMVGAGYITLKRYKSSTDKDLVTEHFANEVRIQSDLRHPNILMLMAACYGPPLGDRCLVLEPVERGFLHRLIHIEQEPLDEDTTLEIARDVACGLLYMHERGFIHCFLGTHSVVITESYKAKICNFEYCQGLNNGDSSGNPISHLEPLYEWMAPEQLMGKGADKLGDVYSFGILIWECVTRKRPFHNVSNFKFIMKNEDPRIQMIPGKWSGNIRVLIKDCIVPAEKRPSSLQVFDWIDGVTSLRLVNTSPANMVIDDLPCLFPKVKVKLDRMNITA